MGGWALFSSVVVAVPLIAVAVWAFNEQASSRRRRKFLQRYSQRSVSGIRNRIEQELSAEDTHTIPKIQAGTLPPDPLQDGTFSGNLPLSKRPRRYARRCTRESRNKRPEQPEQPQFFSCGRESHRSELQRVRSEN